MKRSVRILLLGILLLGFFAAAILFSEVLGGSKHTVRLTDNGFVPAELTIKKGDTVVFTTQLQEAFWPASNVHPSHTIYSDFDPRRPIEPQGSWSFTFTKEGQWKYHDHLNSRRTGSIIVGEVIQTKVANDCLSLAGEEKIQCFDNTLEVLQKEKGIEAAFAYFVEIYHADPEVPAVCHGWTHRLGEIEYELYTKGREVTLRPEATFCSYGYFHGFINAMVEDTQSLQSAQAFCREAVEEQGDELRSMKSHCVHGIGHSITSLSLEAQKQPVDIIAVVDQGAPQCEALYGSSSHACLDGMLHELYLTMVRGEYGLSTEEYENSGDIFYYCHLLSGEIAESCYYESVALWPYFLGTDKGKVIEYLRAHPSNLLEKSPRILHALGRSFIETDIKTGSFESSALACTSLPEHLQEGCEEGLALGFATYGEPNNMHETAFAFCRDQYAGAERISCLGNMIDALQFSYTESQLQNACGTLGPDERPASCSF